MSAPIATRRVLLTITTTHAPATDLGFLLHKNPARVQTFELSFGHGARLLSRRRPTERCTAALLLDVDPVGLVRGAAAGVGGARASTSTTGRTSRRRS